MNIQALETRQQVYEFVQKSPGLHFREMQRQLGLAVGTLQHHLAQLEKEKMVVSRKDGEFTRYYPVGAMTERDKTLLQYLRSRALRRILLFLLEKKSANHRAISRQIGLSPATTSWYLGKALSEGLVRRKRTGRETYYWVVEPDEIARTLIAYRASFLDEMVNRFTAIWEK